MTSTELAIHVAADAALIRAMPDDELGPASETYGEAARLLSAEFDARLTTLLVTGDQTTERALAERFAVSKTAIHNRIQRLEREGRIARDRPKDPRGGARLPAPTEPREPRPSSQEMGDMFASDPSVNAGAEVIPIRPAEVVTGVVWTEAQGKKDAHAADLLAEALEARDEARTLEAAKSIARAYRDAALKAQYASQAFDDLAASFGG